MENKSINAIADSLREKRQQKVSKIIRIISVAVMLPVVVICLFLAVYSWGVFEGLTLGSAHRLIVMLVVAMIVFIPIMIWGNSSFLAELFTKNWKPSLQMLSTLVDERYFAIEQRLVELPAEKEEALKEVEKEYGEEKVLLETEKEELVQFGAWLSGVDLKNLRNSISEDVESVEKA